MLTYLDRWVSAFIKALPEDAVKALKSTYHTDVGIINYLNKVTPIEHMRAPVGIRDAISPFLEAKPNTLAVTMSRELAAIFSNTKVAGSEAAYKDIIDQYNSIYIDVPEKTFVFNEEFQLNAVFIVRDRSGVANYVNCFSKIGKPFNLIEEISEVVFSSEGDTSFYSNFPVTQNSYLKPRILDLCRSVLLYYVYEGQRSGELPRINPTNLASLSGKKQRAKQKKASLFRVKYLNPDPYKLVGKRSPKASWELSHRVEVQSYFRMQPYGEGNKQRRFQLVRGYVKGACKPSRSTMYKL